jgi:hypothetical protein
MKGTEPFVLADFSHVGMVEMSFHNFLFPERNGDVCFLVLIAVRIRIHFFDGKLQFGLDIDWLKGLLLWVGMLLLDWVWFI